MSKESKRGAAPGVAPGQSVNMVRLAGEIKSMKVNVADGRCFFLIQTTQAEEWIPCTIYENGDLARKLSAFREGDYIQVSGFVRPWSQQKAGSDRWENHMDVRVERIVNEAPERQQGPDNNQGDIPW